MTIAMTSFAITAIIATYVQSLAPAIASNRKPSLLGNIDVDIVEKTAVFNTENSTVNNNSTLRPSGFSTPSPSKNSQKDDFSLEDIVGAIACACVAIIALIAAAVIANAESEYTENKIREVTPLLREFAAEKDIHDVASVDAVLKTP